MEIAQPVRITAAGQVITGKVLLSGITFDVTTDGKGIILYDGFGTSDGVEKLSLVSIAKNSNHISFQPPILFQRGIYATIDSQLNAATLELITLQEGLTF